MRLRNIPRNIPIRFKRGLYWRTNSSPFLSGDVFADLSDLSFYNPKFRGQQPSLRLASEAQVVFCPSHKLEALLEDYGQALLAKVLILGNSDRDFYEFNFNLPPSIRHVLLQNSAVTDERFSILPIGIENRRLGVNGLPGLFPSESSLAKKSRELLVGPFGNTHTSRAQIRDIEWNSNLDVQVIEERISPRNYAKTSEKFKFVLCPRGNGWDTHRFWETLYRGSIPIVIEDRWAAQIKNLEIPVVQVKEWDELEIRNAVQNFSFPNFLPSQIDALWVDYWIKKIQSYL